MIDQEKFNNVLNAFYNNNLSISQFICDVLEHHHLFASTHAIVIEDLFTNVSRIMTAFMSQPRNVKCTETLVHHYACEMYSKEVQSLTGPGSGLQFNAKHAQAHQVDRFNANSLMSTISNTAPRLWALSCRLMTADGLSKRSLEDPKKAKLTLIVSTSTSRLYIVKVNQGASVECDVSNIAHNSGKQ